MATVNHYLEEEIDLREVLRSLLRYRWLILILPVVFALAGYAVSRFALPHEYQASALVQVAKPPVTINLDTRLQTSYQVPDLNTMRSLAESQEVIQSVISSPQVIEAQNQTPGAQEGGLDMKAEAVGTTQLRLTVTGISPQAVAQAANEWAAQLARKANSEFAPSQDGLADLEKQLSEAYTRWAQSEQALLDNLKKNPLDVYKVRFDQASKSLTTYLDRIQEIDRAVTDIKRTQATLSGDPGSRALGIEEIVRLLALEEWALGSPQTMQLQIPLGTTLEEPVTVEEARARLERLIPLLEQKRSEAQANADEMQAKISQYSIDYETAQYQKNQYTIQRDLDQVAYQALAGEVKETRLAMAQSQQVAKVVGSAAVPTQPSGPSALTVAMVAAVFGLALAIGLAILREWWRAPAAARS